VIAADQQRVWQVIEDPHHLPRWWPGITRMEGVERDRFTQVFTSKRGRTVRLDFRLLSSEPPGPDGDPPGVRRWQQELYGTPFERVLSEAVTEMTVEPAGAGADRARGFERGKKIMRNEWVIFVCCCG